MEPTAATGSKHLFTVVSAGDARAKFVHAADLTELIEKGRIYYFKYCVTFISSE